MLIGYAGTNKRHVRRFHLLISIPPSAPGSVAEHGRAVMIHTGGMHPAAHNRQTRPHCERPAMTDPGRAVHFPQRESARNEPSSSDALTIGGDILAGQASAGSCNGVLRRQSHTKQVVFLTPANEQRPWPNRSAGCRLRRVSWPADFPWRRPFRRSSRARQPP